MFLSELLRLRTPFRAQNVHDKRIRATVIYISDNDPLGVGGGLLPKLPTVHFKGGGWCLARDFVQHWELVRIAKI